MKAIVQEKFGPPDTLRLADLDRPEPGPGEVLVQVRAAAFNPYDWHMLRGDPRIARLLGATGLRRPKSLVAGVDAAGRVSAVGAGVTGLVPGDEVLGEVRGAFAEFALARAELLVPRPAGLTWAEAAAVPMAAATALRGLRDVAGVRPGQRVLVNGASGGVGTFAVQIGAALGAEVTGVCSTRNVELVRSLGAARVVDYTAADFTDEGERYDLVLDNAGSQPLGRLRRVLSPAGTLVLNAGGSPGKLIGPLGTMVSAMVINGLVRPRVTVMPYGESQSQLLGVTELIEAGQVRPVLDRDYPLAAVADGLRYLERGHARGKVTVSVA